MINELFAPTAVIEAFTQTWMAIAAQLLKGAPVSATATSASLRAAIRAGSPTPTAQALDRMRVAIRMQR